jgi:arabinofuranosyltransferase
MLTQFTSASPQRPGGSRVSIASWKLLLLITALVGFVTASFFWQAYHIAGGPGFPLDDAWIYARYADNLARGYGFSYNRGTPSSGATSSLWALLLAATHTLGVPPIPAGLTWGILLLIASCWMTYKLALAVGQSTATGVIAAVFTTLMSRLIWGALSGMEVSLFVFLTLLALTWHVHYGLENGWRSYLSTIALALAALGRPECYALLPIAWLDRILTSKLKPTRLFVAFLPHLALYCLVLAPNWAFNASITGSIFPATFHAKVSDGFLEALRLGDVQMLLESVTIRPLNFLYKYIAFLAENNLVLLIPAFWGLIDLVRRRRQTGSMVVPLVFVLVPLAMGIFGQGHLAGRYIANLTPLYVVLAVTGGKALAGAVKRLPFPTSVFRIAGIAVLLLALLNAAVVGVYASAKYGWMVENINAMHVYMGHWIAENTPPDALIAMNDVGAMTYFGNREIIDTVGLTTPDIIPYLKEPSQARHESLLRYLQERQPDYLALFPRNYPNLVARTDLFEPVYTHVYTGGNDVTIGGGDVLIVYRCHWPGE